jgi:hypothetical protein
VTLFDDQWSPAINIGFTFCFYGTAYTQCVIGSNGLISFNIAQAGGYCQWPINAAVPSAADPMNTVMGPWQDLYPPGGGTIRYTVYGAAPCRRFVVSWNQMPMYSCTSTLCTQQIVLYETTNVIENFIQTKPLCASWNAGTAIQAIHNAAGTAAVAVAGRNAGLQTEHQLQQLAGISVLHYRVLPQTSVHVLRQQLLTTSAQPTRTVTVQQFSCASR